MIKLTDRQTKLAEQLLLTVIKKEMNVTYSELAERITPPMHHRQVGKDIGEISKLCHQLGLPLLSAKVINKNSNSVGDGFFGLYEELGIDVGENSEKELCRMEKAKIRECKDWYKLADYLGLDLPFDHPIDNIYPDEINEKEVEKLIEGTTKRVNVNVYERNPEARKICLEKHGYDCSVCGFNFEKAYGKIGHSFIHVHHIIPLHKIKKGYVVNGETDLIPVCPNCHSMLHREIDGKNLSVDELRKLVKE